MDELSGQEAKAPVVEGVGDVRQSRPDADVTRRPAEPEVRRTRSLLDPSDGDDLLDAVAGRFGFRDWMTRHPGLRLVYRIAVGVVGGLVLAAGIVMIPYPGPGWFVVFVGLAILATEFTWAERALRYAKGRYDIWNEWVKRQHPVVRALIWTATAMIVVLTLWLLDVYEMVGGWFGLHWTWLSSPIL